MHRVQNFVRDLQEWHNSIQNSQFRAGSRHSVNCTTRLILAYRKTTFTMNRLHSLRAVRSHSCHDDSHCQRAKRGGYRLHRKPDLNYRLILIRRRSSATQSAPHESSCLRKRSVGSKQEKDFEDDGMQFRSLFVGIGGRHPSVR